MAKDYGRNRNYRKSSNVPKQFLLSLSFFLVGYVTASIFDFASVRQWFNTQVLAQQGLIPKTPSNQPSQVATLPKPKFEFYTLLAANERGAAAPAPPQPKAEVATVKAPVIAAATKTTAPGVAPLVAPSAPVARATTSNPVAVVEAKPVAPARFTKDTYAIQVASFKTRQDAEHLKASLIFKGFMVSVAPVTQPQGTWFRVLIGPYANRAQALKAQSAVSQSEHMMGMIRKMDA